MKDDLLVDCDKRNSSGSSCYNLYGDLYQTRAAGGYGGPRKTL